MGSDDSPRGGSPDWGALYSIAQSQSGCFTTGQAATTEPRARTLSRRQDLGAGGLVLADASLIQRVSRVDQLRGSWNLLLSWLREVQAWGQGAEAEG